MDKTTPILYFAFANQEKENPSKPEQERYLASLNNEIKGIKKKFLKDIVNNNLIFLIDEQTERIELGTKFIEMKESSAPKFIHFAGHADSDHLILIENKPINANSLANLLQGLTHVKLVFLNACCTKELKNFLLTDKTIGVEAVIATSKKIGDIKASEFANHFYDSFLRKNKSLIAAFNEACGNMEDFNTVSRDNGRGITREDDNSDDFEWGLYWRDDQYKDIKLIDGAIQDIDKIDASKISLGEEYEAKLKEISSEEEDIKTKLEAKKEKLKEEGKDNMTIEIFLSAFEEGLNGRLTQLKEEADKKLEEIINYNKTPKLKQAIDGFNFSKEITGLNKLLQDEGKGLQNGMYLLRGTAYCGLGLLSYRIVTYGKPITYGFTAPRIDFKGIAEEKDIVKNIKTELFSSNNTISSFEELAKELDKTHLAKPDVKPFVLILNNAFHAFKEDTTELNNVFDKFWKPLNQKIKGKDHNRQILVLMIENIDDSDYIMIDTQETEEKEITFCGLPYTTAHQDNNIFALKKVATVNKEYLDEWCGTQTNQALFFQWLKKTKEFIDEKEPFVGKTLINIAKKLGNEKLENHILSRNNFDFT